MLETPARIEPAFFEDETPNILASLASEIQSEVVDLGAGLHPHASAELADFVRMMNCYYSNLIEGHNTRPKDIESAVQGAELDPERRPLALEAKAHVTVQREIDLAYADGTLASPVSREFLSWVHREFYQNMPEEFRTAKAPGGRSVPIVPGAFRASGEEARQPRKKGRTLAWRPKSREETPKEGKRRLEVISPSQVHNMTVRRKRSSEIGDRQRRHACNAWRRPEIVASKTISGVSVGACGGRDGVRGRSMLQSTKSRAESRA